MADSFVCHFWHQGMHYLLKHKLVSIREIECRIFETYHGSISQLPCKAFEKRALCARDGAVNFGGTEALASQHGGEVSHRGRLEYLAADHQTNDCGPDLTDVLQVNRVDDVGRLDLQRRHGVPQLDCQPSAHRSHDADPVNDAGARRRLELMRRNTLATQL